MCFSGIPKLLDQSSETRRRIFDLKYLKTREELEVFSAWLTTLADPHGVLKRKPLSFSGVLHSLSDGVRMVGAQDYASLVAPWGHSVPIEHPARAMEHHGGHDEPR
jgi:hypothetical protein